ncbi:MAG: PilX N-terminal domain-containing pilus assembly protein [Terriglobia bacterium]|jgi:hypothetical protein
MRNRLSRTCSFLNDPDVAVTPCPSQGRFQDRGVALIITLLLLFLLSVVGLAAVVSTSSDLMINGYYKNYRGSFYAADSGMNMAREAIYTYFNTPANAPATWPTLQSVATSAGNNLATSAGTYVTGLYGSSTSLNTGTAASSVPASFTITTATITLPSAPTPTGSAGNYTNWQYVYNYTLESQGTSRGSETAQIIETGAITVNITQGSGTSTTNASFAAFGAFIDSFSACQGPLVQGYLTGPMYAMGQWNLSTGSSPGYTFTDPVSQTGSQFSYYDGSNCANSSSVPYTFSDRNTVNPSFQSGYNLNVTPVTLPANSFSQQWAVLDGKGCGEGTNVCGNTSSPAPPQPTNAQMNAILQDVTQTPYPAGGATSGVYLPYTCTAGVCSLNSNAGGVYVEGSSSVATAVTMSTANGAGGSSNPSAQVFTIAQTFGSTTGSAVVTQVGSTSCSGGTCTANFQQQTTTTTPTTFTTVTVDPASGTSGTTTVSAYTQNAYSTVTATGSNTCSYSGSNRCTPSAPNRFNGGSTSNSSANGSTTNLSLSGVPEDLLTSPAQAATMIYVDDDVTITGPSSGAAIQNNSMVNLTANGNITQTGNILYATEPVTTSANQKITGSNPACCNGDPADTLIPQNENMNQVLGIFTAAGNFILSPTSANGSNIETDASVAMISQAGITNSSIGHLQTGNSVGTWTNIGGRMENRAASVSMSSSNVYFDRRFQARTNFAPPWFPSTSVSTNMLTNTITAASSANPPSRTSWQYQAGQ